MKTFFGTMALTLLLVSPVLAQTDNSTPPAGMDEDKVGGTAAPEKLKGPGFSYSNHKVRMEACQSKSSGDSCAFINRKGKRIAGVCAEEGKGSDAMLMCKPNKKGKGHRK